MKLSQPNKKLNEVVKQFGKAFDQYEFICIDTIDENNIDAYFIHHCLCDWIVLHVDKTLYNKHGKIRFEGNVKYVFEITKSVPDEVEKFRQDNRCVPCDEFNNYIKVNLYKFSRNVDLLPESGFRLVDYKDNKKGPYYHLWFALSKVESFMINIYPQREEFEFDIFDECFGMGVCVLNMKHIQLINRKLEELEKLGILVKKQ